jgi:hypothetical protein
MITLFLLLVIVAIVLGIVGVVAKGLLFLLVIGIVVFLGALTLAALRMHRTNTFPAAAAACSCKVGSHHAALLSVMIAKSFSWRRIIIL